MHKLRPNDEPEGEDAGAHGTLQGPTKLLHLRFRCPILPETHLTLIDADNNSVKNLGNNLALALTNV